jgi:predicted HD phosphohydrolase
MTEAQAAAFRQMPFAEEAVRLRRWDDSGKITGLPTMPFASFKPLLQRVLDPA